jgi:hypothetical protein
VSSIILKDTIILQLGQELYLHTHELQSTENYVINFMRELGRLVLAARGHDSGIIYVADLVDASKWAIFMQATMDLARIGSSHPAMALATKIGQHIMKVAHLALVHALQTHDEPMIRRVKNFTQLKQLQWKSSYLRMARITRRFKTYPEERELGVCNCPTFDAGI